MFKSDIQDTTADCSAIIELNIVPVLRCIYQSCRTCFETSARTKAFIRLVRRWKLFSFILYNSGCSCTDCLPLSALICWSTPTIVALLRGPIFIPDAVPYQYSATTIIAWSVNLAWMIVVQMGLRTCVLHLLIIRLVIVFKQPAHNNGHFQHPEISDTTLQCVCCSHMFSSSMDKRGCKCAPDLRCQT